MAAHFDTRIGSKNRSTLPVLGDHHHSDVLFAVDVAPVYLSLAGSRRSGLTATYLEIIAALTCFF